MSTKLKMIKTRHCAINSLCIYIENKVCSVCMSGTKKEWKRKMEREPFLLDSIEIQLRKSRFISHLYILILSYFDYINCILL